MTLLDTNICLGILRGDANVIARYRRSGGDVAISAMTVGELFLGAEKSQRRDANRRLVEAFVAAVPAIHTNNAIMRRFAVEKARLQSLGTPVEDADALIAATALSLGCPLATGNTRHFSRSPGLEISNWFVID